MLQPSDVPEQDGKGAPSPPITVAPTTPEAARTGQQLAVELQAERCLNQLGLKLNACVSAFLAAVTSSLEMIDSTRVHLAQILVNELSAALGEWCALTLQPTEVLSDRPAPSEPPAATFTVWAIASGDSHTTAPLPIAVGQTLSDRDLQHWQAQSSASSWQVRHGQVAVGWLLLAPVATAPHERLSEAESHLVQLRPWLLEQSCDRFCSALLQVELIQTQRQQQQELVARNRELNQTSQLKSDFLANTSHEIRTPLSSILGFTHLMREQGFNASSKRHQEYLNIILSSGQHLLALINDILDLSKIEANQLDLFCESTAVKAVCETAITLVREKASDKGLTLKLEIAPQVDTLVVDALRLKQMLFNLLSNALKFTSKGSVGLQVSAIDSGLCFTVWDTGTGISEDQQQLLFRPYSQLVNAEANRDEGTGLGLALTQKLAELHGGSVEVSSTLGFGSRFTIVLPLVPPMLASGEDKSGEDKSGEDKRDEDKRDEDKSGEDKRDEEKAVERAIAQSSSEIHLAVPAAVTGKGSKAVERLQAGNTSQSNTSQISSKTTKTPSRSNHLLLVEDNYYNAKLVLTYLSRLGYEVTWVKDGYEMRQALLRALPALILMDVNLPHEDGLALTQELKRDARYRSIPVIAQTAMAMTGDRDLCLEAGSTAYISKPIDLKALAQLLTQHVKLARD
ncbi:response regulator [Phormidium sp. FACHB-592]|uniref:histidine kinase n=1 Tax=Stenomitos frigidus AS-A4 TaxID=2933935 RepID=A0ABV0KNE8_9CYAN|nr:ATP-binding protein [Phormidium sp. FACHB-592]MBD2072967.1 response regulator [Phormidium sp. FACHB-592]